MDESRLVGGAVYVIGTDAYLDGASPTPAMVDALAEDIRAAGHHWPDAVGSPDRWKLRSATYSGIAAAMAQQWGGQL